MSPTSAQNRARYFSKASYDHREKTFINWNITQITQQNTTKNFEKYKPM